MYSSGSLIYFWRIMIVMNQSKAKVEKNFCRLRQWKRRTKILFKVIHNLPMFIWGQFSIDVTVKHQSLPISNPSTPHLMHWKLLSLLNLKSKIHEGRILKNLNHSKRFINILENFQRLKKIQKDSEIIYSIMKYS